MKKTFKVILPLFLLAVLVIFGAKTARAEDLVPIKTIANSSTSKPSYSESLIVGTSNCFAVYSVKATATGKMYVDIKAGENNYSYIYTYIGSDFDGSNFTYSEKNYGFTAAGETETGKGCFDVTKGNTYYIGVKSSSSYAQGDTAQLRAYIYSYANNRTLTASSSKYTLSSGVKGSSNDYTTLYYKVTPTKTGVMTVTLKNYGYTGSYGYITLMNSAKKALSEEITYSSSGDAYKVRFGVKKGATYYLKVKTTYVTSSECYKYGIKYTVSAASDRSIGTKTKALNLKRGATATKTLFIAKSSTETDWYKFKVTSKRETVFKVDLTQMRGTSAKVTITVYCGSKKIASTTQSAGTSYDYTITNSTTYGKANKGTYYVKITRSTKLSGLYKVKYVK